jgi:peptide/nickel transport system substrate-binding protein
MYEKVELHGLSRRDFLRRGALTGGLLLGGGSLLAACGGDDDEAAEPSGGGGAGTGAGAGTEATTTTAAAPKEGGTLRIGISGGGSNDQIAVGKATNQSDFFREPQLYEGLYDRDVDYNLIPNLAESSEANETADQWTVRLKEGVEFHNGKTVTADDIIAGIQRHFDESYGYTYMRTPFEVIGIDPARIDKIDDLTVRFNLKAPYAIFEESMTYLFVTPADYDQANPVGTGPFKFQSFTAGQESVFVKHENYHQEGPYVDELQVLDFADDTARVNALLAGQVDAIDSVPAGQIAVVQGNDQLQILITETGLWRPITMRVDTAPFDDVRVRQAFRLIPNRQEMIEQAMAGQAIMGNDLYSPHDPCSIAGVLQDVPDALPQRDQDIEQAISLLSQAGHDGLEVEMVTSPVNGGVVQMSEVFVQQAKAANVTVNLRRVDPGTFYGDQYLKWTFAVDWWGVTPYLGQVINADGPAATWNETHFDHPQFNSLFQQALQELDPDKRCDIQKEMQRIQYEEGGYIIPYHPNVVDAATAATTGWQPWKTGDPLNGANVRLISFV